MKIFIHKIIKFYHIIIIYSIYILLLKVKRNNILVNKINIEEQIYSKDIYYKGIKVLKEKLINDYLSKISNDYIYEKAEEKNRFNRFYYLANYSDNTKIKNILKKKFLYEVTRIKNQTINKLENVYLSRNFNFGNNIIAINNAINFCEVVGCHKIILNKHILKRKLLIVKSIYYKKSNITITTDSNVDCKNDKTLCFYENSWNIYYSRIIIPQVKITILRKEILSNLPVIKIGTNDLYMHIRGGDIFTNFIVKSYAQPPLCFYEKILEKYKFFNNIYIISIDRSNIVIKALLSKYKKIIHKINTLEIDISLLCNAFNIVISVSSFALSCIKLNNNLQNIWEFDMMRLSEKFFFLHHDIFKFQRKYIIHTMKPSEIYINKMFLWKNSEEQIRLMLTDKCPYDFIISK